MDFGQRSGREPTQGMHSYCVWCITAVLRGFCHERHSQWKKDNLWQAGKKSVAPRQVFFIFMQTTTVLEQDPTRTSQTFQWADHIISLCQGNNWCSSKSIYRQKTGNARMPLLGIWNTCLIFWHNPLVSCREERRLTVIGSWLSSASSCFVLFNCSWLFANTCESICQQELSKVVFTFTLW